MARSQTSVSSCSNQNDGPTATKEKFQVEQLRLDNSSITGVNAEAVSLLEK